MNARQLISALVILMFSFSLQAQNETILFGQQKAINNLSKDAGVSSKELDDYLKKRYQRPLYQLTQSEGADIIEGFQDGRLSRNSISDYLRPAVQAVNNTQSQSPVVKKEDLIAASVLEVGMKKRFHFKDGSISEGEIINLEEDLVVLVTASGEFRIPKGEFLAETAEITNKKGERFVGHVLSESEEEFVIRTQYGDAKIHKREIEKMSRFHGGVKDPNTEMTKRVYMVEASLL